MKINVLLDKFCLFLPGRTKGGPVNYDKPCQKYAEAYMCRRQLLRSCVKNDNLTSEDFLRALISDPFVYKVSSYDKLLR